MRGLYTLSQGKYYIRCTLQCDGGLLFYLFYVSYAEDHYLNGLHMPY